MASASVDDAVRQGNAIAADPVLLERLGLKVGDKLKLGEAEPSTVRATIAAEPDGIVDRLTYGPRVLLSLATLAKDGTGAAGCAHPVALCVEAQGR